MKRIATGDPRVVVALLAAGGAAARRRPLQQVGGFEAPIYVTSDPGNPDRLFVAERGGRIQLQSRTASISVFADLTLAGQRLAATASAACSRSPWHRTSTAAAASSSTTPTTTAEIHVDEMRRHRRQRRRRACAKPPDDPTPGQATTTTAASSSSAPKDYLFISTGDGGGSDDEHHNAQDLDSLLGKILRIDPDPGGLPYTVPTGNPFAGEACRNAIWSLRPAQPLPLLLRPPRRRPGDRRRRPGHPRGGRLRAAAPAARRRRQLRLELPRGRSPGPGHRPRVRRLPPSAFVDPVFDYPHDDPGAAAPHGCAIIGGYVVRDPSLGDLFGRYLYGDLCDTANCAPSTSVLRAVASDRWRGPHGRQPRLLRRGLAAAASTSSPAAAASPASSARPRTPALRAAGADSRVGPLAVGITRRPPQGPPRKRAPRSPPGSPPATGAAASRSSSARPRPPRHPPPRPRLHGPLPAEDHSHAASFRADDRRRQRNYVAATSRKLRIKILHRKPAKRRGRTSGTR